METNPSSLSLLHQSKKALVSVILERFRSNSLKVTISNLQTIDDLFLSRFVSKHIVSKNDLHDNLIFKYKLFHGFPVMVDMYVVALSNWVYLFL